MDFLQSLCLYLEKITFGRCMLNNCFSATTLNTVIFVILFSHQNRSLLHFMFSLSSKTSWLFMYFQFSKISPWQWFNLPSKPKEIRLQLQSTENRKCCKLWHSINYAGSNDTVKFSQTWSVTTWLHSFLTLDFLGELREKQLLLTVKSSPGHTDQVGIFRILPNYGTLVFHYWRNYSKKINKKLKNNSSIYSLCWQCWNFSWSAGYSCQMEAKIFTSCVDLHNTYISVQWIPPKTQTR